MISFQFWQRWLLGAGLLMAAFAVVLALFSGTPLFGWMMAGINSPFWPDGQEISPAIRSYQQWIIGLLGAVMAAWALTLGFLAHFAFKKRETWSWVCLVCGLCLWFVIDEGVSIAYTVTFNAVLNLVFWVMLGLPLIFTWKEFFKK